VRAFVPDVAGGVSHFANTILAGWHDQIFNHGEEAAARRVAAHAASPITKLAAGKVRIPKQAATLTDPATVLSRGRSAVDDPS